VEPGLSDSPLPPQRAARLNCWWVPRSERWESAFAVYVFNPRIADGLSPSPLPLSVIPEDSDPMTTAMHCLRLTGVAVALLAVPLQPVSADEVKAIETGGTGELTMCPVWGFSCNLYHHIDLPPRIATGDKVPVSFGSNPKQYDFPAAIIVMHDGNGCTVFSQLVKTENVEKIDVPSCHAVLEAQ